MAFPGGGGGGNYFIDGEYPVTHYDYNHPHYQHDYVPVAQDLALYRSDYYYDNNYNYEDPPFSSSSRADHCYYTAYASIASEPLFLAYEQAPSLTYYSESYQQTRPIVSYSVLEFNEDDFLEYDPTPYGGGYDPVQTYGSPLPHSDETCYPRSTANQIAGAGAGPIAAGVSGKHPQMETGKKPTSPKNASEEAISGIAPPSTTAPIVAAAGAIAAAASGKPPPMGNGKEPTSPKVPTKEAVGKGNGGYGYGGGEAGRVIPAGYGLETVDLCESLFGYWPCLAKIRRENENDHGGVKGKEEVDGDWNETAADYLFGSWYDPYDDGERREEDRLGYYQWWPDEKSENEQPLPFYRRPADMYVEDHLWYNDSTSSQIFGS